MKGLSLYRGSAVPKGKHSSKIFNSTENIDMKESIPHVKEKLGEFIKIKFESKLLHGQCIGSVDRQLVGGEDMLLWLLGGDLKGETGRKIRAAQGQALQTKYRATKILRTETDSKCRM